MSRCDSVGYLRASKCQRRLRVSMTGSGSARSTRRDRFERGEGRRPGHQDWRTNPMKGEGGLDVKV